MTLQEAFDVGFDAVKAYVDDALAGFERRLAVAEARTPEKGEPGKDADMAFLSAQITREVAQAVAAVPNIEQAVQRAVSALPKPQDGKSVTLDEVAPLIERAVAALPKAKDGTGLAGAVIDRSGELVITLSDGSTQKLGSVIGPAGKDIDIAVVRGMVQIEVGLAKDEIAKKAAALIPVPKSVTVEEVLPVVKETATGIVSEAKAMVRNYFESFPKPKDGIGIKSALIGSDGHLILTLTDSNILDLGCVVGQDGEHGKSVTLQELVPVVEADVRRLVAEIPKPENGKDAAPLSPTQIADAVADYLRQNPPPAGESIQGDPGRGIGDLLIDVGGNLVVTFTDGTTKTVGKVQGRDGVDAKGTNGIGIMRAGINPVGELCLHLTDESILNVGCVVGKDGLPGMEDAGVYKAGTSYERGNVVTWDGSAWVCKEPTTDKPGTSKAWRLFVRKGQDGRNGKDAPQRKPSTIPFGDK